MGHPDIVSVQWLKEHFKKVKILDATETIKPMPNVDEFEAKYYGNFELLQKDFVEDEYLKEHIPGAVHFNFDIAYCPTTFKRYGLYNANIFEKYAQLLGINQNDHLVIYSRGPLAGCLFASRVYWTFKVYGFHKVSILNGGLSAWKNDGGEVTSGEEHVPRGDFKAESINLELLERFEKIPFKNLDDVQFVDVRTPAQYCGEEPLTKTYPKSIAKGSHVPKSKNLPAGKFFDANGFKSKDEIRRIVDDAGIKTSHPIILSCNGGVQASAVFAALQHCGILAKVYNGSMSELASRAPHLVNGRLH
ncbi:unnamed protein product [Caenorhabditis bovis]|uniref:Rhodanese domain-containing protein n=1 Tax=Caenorhabditis bovis TaxID=2654633 RepID=A0A8S1EBY1_9PELO|nr:unnamed protein product [Caenorhabditis bovis]